MTELLEYFISEFKKLKRVRGNVFENFITFVNLLLTDKKDDYKLYTSILPRKKQWLKYIKGEKDISN